MALSGLCSPFLTTPSVQANRLSGLATKRSFVDHPQPYQGYYTPMLQLSNNITILPLFPYTQLILSYLLNYPLRFPSNLKNRPVSHTIMHTGIIKGLYAILNFRAFRSLRIYSQHHPYLYIMFVSAKVSQRS